MDASEPVITSERLGPLTRAQLQAALALAGCGGGAKTGASTTPTPPTATVAPTQTPSPPGAWATLNSCGANVPGVLRVQYQGGLNEYAVQRSDDCGTNWRTLANPQIPGVSNSGGTGTITYWSLSGAPAYTDTAYITAQVKSDPQLCPATTCQVQYVSTNGGQSWARLKTPVPGYLDTLQPSVPLASAIGTRLYGMVTDALITFGPGSDGKQLTALPPARLVTSSDHGATWTLCDAQISAQGLRVAYYAAPPVGSDLFVVAEPKNDSSVSPPLTLWVSHDAGDTWAAAGSPPGVGTSATPEGEAGGAVRAAFASRDTASGRFTLYLAVVVSGHSRVMASADGGQTWQGDPSLVLDTDSQGYSLTFLGAPSDGSLLLEYPAGDGQTIAWKPGSSVRTVAQNAGFQSFFGPIISPDKAGVTLWLSGGSGPGGRQWLNTRASSSSPREWEPPPTALRPGRRALAPLHWASGDPRGPSLARALHVCWQFTRPTVTIGLLARCVSVWITESPVGGRDEG